MSIPARQFFTPEEQQHILDAISEAERNTSGEIRVHLENSCRGNLLDRAAEWFHHLRMHRTERRNGVLFYLAIRDQQFAILGDQGINQVVPADFWDQIKARMQARFRNGEFLEGLQDGIREAGHQLKQHFPYQTNDVNELPNDISFGKE